MNEVGWEYKAIDIHPYGREFYNSFLQLNIALNHLGKKRWELVNVDDGIAYFKRQKEIMLSDMTDKEILEAANWEIRLGD